MTQFLDCRLWPVGGELAKTFAVYQTPPPAQDPGDALQALKKYIQGQHVLIATHGFNVNRADGIGDLSNWETLLRPPPSSAFVGLLWPGDSVWLHGLDYPEEASVADDAGLLLAKFLDANFQGAASVSLASHSLGARVMLSAIKNTNTRISRLVLMAGAIDDDCLNDEFQAAAAKVGAISVLASTKDTVLADLFPLGNFFAGLLDQGHPWHHAALGRSGPVSPTPVNFRAPFQLPDDWEFLHSSYLQISNPPPAPIQFSLPADVPRSDTPIPANELDANGEPILGWSAEFSSAFTSTRLG
jgi:pimeloyl-ACP methyl ester carboxylesterase